MSNPTFPCFGFEALGQCAYNPATPSIYFDLGAVISALVFTFAAHQLLRPIYRFRLGIYYLSPARLYSLVFAGAAAILTATILPNMPWLHGGPWGYAINWEIFGALLFAIPYAAVVLAVVRPVRVWPARIVAFARGAASLLSSANEQDHIDFANDLSGSFPELLKAASFIDRLEETTAFYDFANRDKIERASFAAAILRIVSDPSLCETLVKRSPWSVAGILQDISKRSLYAEAAEQFIRQISRQAILRDDGMMAREVGYHGFQTAPLLSEALFGNWYTIERYNPFGFPFAIDADDVTPAMLRRFNAAVERTFSILIEHKAFYFPSAAYGIRDSYRSLFMRAYKLQEAAEPDNRLIIELNLGVERVVDMANALLSRASPRSYASQYATDPSDHRHDFLGSMVEIVFEALTAISNRFKGPDDVFWGMAFTILSRAFDHHFEQLDGLTPFQQRLALKIIDKLRDNLKGWYPALCRVLLAYLGPYERPAAQQNRTAFNILLHAVYYELQQGLPQLAASKPEKILNYLPDNVTFDIATGTLIHTFADGAQVTTVLNQLDLQPISLVDAGIRRPQAEPAPGQPQRE